MDGGTTANIYDQSRFVIYGLDMLRAADVGGELNSQVVEMLQNFQPWYIIFRVTFLKYFS